jgi:hypothetical protein
VQKLTGVWVDFGFLLLRGCATFCSEYLQMLTVSLIESLILVKNIVEM